MGCCFSAGSFALLSHLRLSIICPLRGLIYEFVLCGPPYGVTLFCVIRLSVVDTPACNISSRRDLKTSVRKKHSEGENLCKSVARFLAQQESASKEEIYIREICVICGR